MKKLILTWLVLIISLVGCVPFDASKSDKLRVVTTLFPLYDFARQIGQDWVDVTLLLPPGVEPHTFDPTPGDIVRINSADVFIYTGDNMEPWVRDVLKSLDNPKLVVIDASKNLSMLPDADGESVFDPHIWLNFSNDRMIITDFMQAFSTRDSVNRDFYVNNAATYEKELSQLDVEYVEALGNCKTRKIFYAGHYAFAYLAQRYNLEYFAAQGISPDAEPTAQDLINLVKQIKNETIPYVFYEELTSPKIAETIAGETNAQMLLLNAAHNVTQDQLDQGVSFLQIMRDNLVALKQGLQCQI